MSVSQGYFPPQGTKWKWGNKVLQHLGWGCEMSKQREPDLFLHPMRVFLRVNEHDGKYYWSAEITDWCYKHTTKTGVSKDPLTACLRAEKAGEAAMDKLLPEWARIALANKWRPPATPVR